MKKRAVLKRPWGFIGIDPGKSGGISVIRTDGSVWSLTPMPTTERDVFNALSPYGMGLGQPIDVRAIIEKVHAMPKQGVSSTFTFGRGYGFLRGCLIALGIPFDEVTPQRWMKSFGIASRGKTETKAQFKQRLRGLAQQLFPSEKITLATADALLIAEFCRRLHNGQR